MKSEDITLGDILIGKINKFDSYLSKKAINQLRIGEVCRFRALPFNSEALINGRWICFPLGTPLFPEEMYISVSIKRKKGVTFSQCFNLVKKFNARLDNFFNENKIVRLGVRESPFTQTSGCYKNTPTAVSIRCGIHPVRKLHPNV